MMQNINSLDEPADADGATDNISDREYINKGLNFWLNNKPNESEIFLLRRCSQTSVLAGYSFVLCMVFENGTNLEFLDSSAIQLNSIPSPFFHRMELFPMKWIKLMKHSKF